MDKVKVGIVGCGNISGIYFKNMRQVFQVLEVKACADLDMDRAKAKAAENPGVMPMTVDQLLADPEIRIVVNLTVPKAHAAVAMRAVEAGKSVHNEKPLTLTREEGKALLKAARAKKVLVGSAPDTFLGAGIQTCRKLVDDGAIGTPVAATAFMMCRGHENWHPDPEFYYEKGGGPMFDMGPYYLTALAVLLGPVARVQGSARISFPTRTITSQKKNGKVIPVEVPTHVAGIMDFASGAVGTIVTSFDVCCHHLPCIEIHGSEGSLQVPDPNGFGGQPLLFRRGGQDWEPVPLARPYAENSRGIGVADMAYSLLRRRRPHRCSGKLAYHVLDLMHAFHDASDKGKAVKIKSAFERPPVLPADLAPGLLDP
jgi:predicted dehydrogenase